MEGAVMTTAGLLDTSDLQPHIATPGARWLRPSAWPTEMGWLFKPGPVDVGRDPVVISRFADVWQVMLGADQWRRSVPAAVVAPDRRHCTLDAAWASDGPTHEVLRGSLSPLEQGSDAAARAYTRELAGGLLAEITRQGPPWDLAPMIYGVSMRAAVEYTLCAPPLLPHLGQLRQLVRAQVTAPGGVLGIARQPELEEILAGLADQHAGLPAGLARDLTGMYLAGALTRPQLAGQLGLVLASSETQATVAASLIGMLLECGEWEYAARAVTDAKLARLLVAEGLRRGIAFPAAMVTAAAPATFGDVAVPAGAAALVSFAASGLDPARFGPDAARFDPRRSGRAHLAFGADAHYCQGAKRARQFVYDILAAVLAADRLRNLRLDSGEVLREVAGVSWVIARLPVRPS
jgi:cytochrome P450